MKNQRGFSTLEVLIVIVFLGIIGFAGWQVAKSKNKSSVATQASSASEQSEPKSTPGANPFCSDYEQICFKYPQDWVSQESKSESGVKGLEIDSPSKKTHVRFVAVLEGVGGDCPEQDCYFTTLSIEEVPSKLKNFKIVKGIYESKSNNLVLPQYLLYSDDRIAEDKLVVGKRVETGFFVPGYKNAKGSIGVFSADPSEEVTNSFSTVEQAKTWFDGSEANQAREILSSIYANTP